MERRHLAYFVAVVEAGSLSEAARRMRLSQPSVSQAIKELERELRTPLIERGRRMTLTAAGRALIGPARRALRTFDDVKLAVKQVDHLATGVLDVAADPLLATDPVAPLITRFRERHPGVRLRIHESAPGVEGLDILRRGEAELLVHSHAAAAPYRSVRLRTSGILAVFPPGTKDLPDGPVSLTALISHDILMGLARQSELRLSFAAELAARDLPPLTVVVETAHRETLIPLVLSGVGVGVLPELDARLAERLGATVRSVDFSVPRTCYLLHRRDPLSPAARAFVGLAKELEDTHPGRAGESE